MDLHVDDEQAGRLAAELDPSSRITLIFYRRASRRYARSVPIPRKDVDMALLERTVHTTYCPYKGDASYFSIPILAKTSTV